MPKIGIVAGRVGGAFLAWQAFRPERLPEGLASSNGRIEAVEIDVAAKTPGRIEDILVRDGDFVRSGQILARMDPAVLQAQSREAEAQLHRARTSAETTHSRVGQTQAKKAPAEAGLAPRAAERAAPPRPP